MYRRNYIVKECGEGVMKDGVVYICACGYV